MSFVRPEARAALSRWSEALIGAALLVLGLWWLWGTQGLLPYVGAALCVVAVCLIWIGIQRGRFRIGAGGAGIVQVSEGQVAYFGPLSGGVRPVNALSAVVLDPAHRPPAWVLQMRGEPDLIIPVNAEGADVLFDAFASLPGLKTGHMLRALEAQPDHAVVIWHEAPTRLH